MSKRKLTRQQAWRIEKIQKERLDRATRHKVEVEELIDSGSLGREQTGRIVARFGKQVEVVAIDRLGQPVNDPIRCHLRSCLSSLVTGDQVVFQATDATGVVTAHKPRRNVLERPDSRGIIKVMAANIDQLIIVTALEPEPQPEILDRYLVAAEVTNIPPIIVINKVDLLRESETNRNLLMGIKNLYEVIGYTVVEATTKKIGGLDELSQYLIDKSSVFIGQSGVGKSSIINKLIYGSEQRVGSISKSGEGRHTTVNSVMKSLNNGGYLIDSPGVRDYLPVLATTSEAQKGFREITEFSQFCRFSNCLHLREPKCAVKKAVEDNLIDYRRYESYKRVVNLTSKFSEKKY